MAGKLAFENPKHGLRIQVPEDWVIEATEEQRPPSYLWAMSKLDNAGAPRLGVFITGAEGQPAVEQFFNNEIATLQKNPLMKVQFSGPANAPGVYEVQFVDPANGLSGRRVYFVRNGMGYTVGFYWPATVSPAELAQLDSVRQAIGLPEARSAVVPGPSTSAARFGPIAFAYWLSTDLNAVLPSTQFPAGINQVYAVLTVDGLKTGDVVAGAWYRGTEMLTGSEYKQTVGERPGPHWWFGYKFSPGAMPGAYRLEISLNGTVMRTGTFEVLPPTSLRFGPIIFAKGTSSDQKLIEPSTQFPAGTSSVLAVFEVAGIEGLKADDIISDVLYRGTEKVVEGKKPASQYGSPVQGPLSAPITYTFSYNPEAMPAGSYHLEVSLNGKVLQTGTFEVLPK
jgi:hypothetical protein